MVLFRHLRPWCVAVIVLVLTACGGGGGGGTSDGGGTVTPPSDTALDQALQTGDASSLTDAAAIAARAQTFVQAAATQQTGLVTAIYSGLGSEYQPTRNSQFIVASNSELAQPLIVGDAGKSLAGISRAEGGRSAAYGVNVLEQFRADANLAHGPVFKRVVTWLVTGETGAALPSPVTIAVAGLNAPNAVTGLGKVGITASAAACDPIADNACGTSADLIVVGSGTAADAMLASRIRAYLAGGKPVLYLHTNSWGDSASGRQMLSAMQLDLGPYAGNYFAQDAVGAGRSASDNLTALDQFAAISPLVARIASGNFRTDYDWSLCTTSVGKVSCSGVAPLQTDIIQPAERVRDQIDAFNRAGRDIFATPNTTLLRLLVLWADVTRRQIVYPLDKAAQPAAFQRAAIADAWVAYVRATGSAQADLGTFATPSIHDLTPSASDEQVTVTLPSASGFTAVGRFVVPGQTAQVELLEAGGATVALRLNTQRTGSTRLWALNGYNRPRYLASPAIALAQGQPLHLNSPYGGTLQVSFSGATPGQTITLRVRGTARHPFLDLSQSGDSALFVSQLNAGQFDWAEIKMAGIEIHSRVDKIKTVLQVNYGNDIDRYLNEIRTLFFEDAYLFAGFAVTGKALPTAVLDRCTTLGWDCTDTALHRIPGTQHINVDLYAECGGGCSGNPYDQTWGLDPRGWGESHELGHNLQPGMLRVYGGRSGEVSNNLFPLHKDWRVFGELGDDRERNRVAYRSAFDMIKAAQAEADPVEGAYQRIWGSDQYAVQNGERLAFYMQWVHYWAERTGDDARGWDIITLLYLHQRLFGQGDWVTNRNKLGYSTYATRPALDSSSDPLAGNDNLLIVLSYLTQRDQRATFDLWGVRYSSAAAAQIASSGYTAEAALFYANDTTNDHTHVTRVDMTAANPAWPF